MENNGLTIARVNRASEDFVRLFSVLHDSCRENEFDDPEHGARAAKLALTLRDKYFEMPDDLFADLEIALIQHDKGLTTTNINIGTCWDADRLDLIRVGIVPKDQFFSTQEGKRLRGILFSKWEG